MGSVRTVLANGVFDVFHVGHVLHLEAAKAMGTKLVVSVTRDARVNKGPRRPVFAEGLRAKVISALRCVDEVILVEDSIEALKRVLPDVFVKGPDYKGRLLERDLEFCREHGIEVCFTNDQKWSSTALVNELRRD